MESLKAYLKKNKNLIDRELDRLLPKASMHPKTLHRAMRYSVFSGGKRLRPILTLEACRVCGGRISDVIKAACTIEMIHTYSLVHDDLPSMDNDDFRRGKPSCHKKFGEASAILAGDALLTYAFGVLADSKKTHRLSKAIARLSQTIGSLGMVGGQEMDLRKKESLNKNVLNLIIDKKTASLFGISMTLGVIFGDANKKEEKRLYKFGKYLGIAFQLMDDSFDNDGYARIIGREETKKKAKEFIEKAKHLLRIFGKKADRLREIADFIIDRKK